MPGPCDSPYAAPDCQEQWARIQARRKGMTEAKPQHSLTSGDDTTSGATMIGKALGLGGLISKIRNRNRKMSEY